MKEFSFEKLIVWQKSRKLAKTVYSITKQFPTEERFGLISQMRRSAISICSNIAEGSGRKSSKEQARYTEIAYGSSLELLNQLIISSDMGFIEEEELSQLRVEISEITSMLNGLRNSQTNKS